MDPNHCQAVTYATNPSAGLINPRLMFDFDDHDKWLVDGRLHREDGPAVVSAAGSVDLWVEGVHRHLDLSSSASVAHGQEWWSYGRRHRIGGPAVSRPDGYEGWWRQGERHRPDGPAVTRAEGTQEWWVDGKLHRGDGPARVWSDGTREWWVDGRRHRTGAPAIVHPDGGEEWWTSGKIHRDRGPAVTWADGKHEWRVDGLRHRTDGPAYSRPDGYEEWWVEGQSIPAEVVDAVRSVTAPGDFDRGLRLVASAGVAEPREARILIHGLLLPVETSEPDADGRPAAARPEAASGDT